MRIISGKFKGLVINTPQGNYTRPTLSRVKESIFNILQNSGSLEGARFLDLFSGTGQIGLEALSRGAIHCTFVDNTTHLLLRQNISKVTYPLVYEILSQNVDDSIKYLQNKPFNYIYLDPPRSYTKVPELLKLIFKYNVLNKNGLIILEQDSLQHPLSYENFIITKTKTYGKTMVSFYREVS